MRLYQIVKILETLALENKRYFTPLYIANRFSIDDIEELTKILLSPLCKGIVVPNFEIECPEGDTDFIVHDPLSIPDESRVCHLCGVEYVPNPKRIWISFNFSDEFVNDLKKKTYQYQKGLQNYQEKKLTLV